jgi:hypothetical protein
MVLEDEPGPEAEFDPTNGSQLCLNISLVLSVLSS